jgi:hypothetical protein
MLPPVEHKTPPPWGIEGLPHGNAPHNPPLPRPHTLVPMGTDYDDDQAGIRFDDPTLCITVEDNQFLVHYLMQLRAVFRLDNVTGQEDVGETAVLKLILKKQSLKT